MSTSETQYCLRVIVGKSYGEEYLLASGDERVIGNNDDADIRLTDDGVEHRHARVRWSGGDLQVEDLGSRKGVRVNGARKKDALLDNGDQLGLGAATLRVSKRIRVLDPSEEPDNEDESPGNGKANGAGGEPERDEQIELRDPRSDDRRDVDEPRPMMDDFDERGLWWPRDELPPLELQHTWFDLARDTTWRSLAIVPTDALVPALPVAHAFARMAALDPNAHVLVVDASPPDEGGPRKPFAGTVASAVKQFPHANYDLLDAGSLGMNDAEVAHIYVPQLLEYLSSGSARYNKVLIATGALTMNARSIPVARAVERVLLTVGLKRADLRDVSRTVEIVGKGRIVGSLVVKPE